MVRCPPVCPIYQLLQQHVADLLLSALWAGDVDRQAAGTQQQQHCHSMVHSSMAVSSSCEQCHVYSRCTRLNTNP